MSELGNHTLGGCQDWRLQDSKAVSWVVKNGESLAWCPGREHLRQRHSWGRHRSGVHGARKRLAWERPEDLSARISEPRPEAGPGLSHPKEVGAMSTAGPGGSRRPWSPWGLAFSHFRGAHSLAGGLEKGESCKNPTRWQCFLV